MAAEPVDLAHDLLVDSSGQHHFDDLDGRGVGHAQAPGKLTLDAEPFQQPRNLRSPAMHHHRLHARLLQHHDVARETLRELRIHHGVAAIFDDDRLLIVALHVGQRLG